MAIFLAMARRKILLSPVLTVPFALFYNALIFPPLVKEKGNPTLHKYRSSTQQKKTNTVNLD